MRLWLVICVGLLSAAAGVQPGACAEPSRRLNILFCFADDWGRYASAYGKLEDRPSPSQVIRTPHIDRVASEGVLFRHAFVTAPSCTPCRSSLLSGQYFFRTGQGAILSGAKWDASIPSFPLLLRDAGYHIGETYKVWSPGTPNDAPFGAGQFAFEKAGGRFNQFSQQVTAMVAKGKTVEAAKAELLAEVSGNFAAFLAQRGEAQPFCYWFGPTNVHRQWIKGSGQALWGLNPDSLQGKLPKFLPDVPEVREDFADYLGEAQAFDAAVGVLLRQLQEAGELDQTLIVISGDHGAPGFPRGKCNLYDFGVGVALVARWPGQPGGRVVDDYVNLMDLAPTFLDAGQVQIPASMTGRSLAPVLKSERQGQVDPQRTWVITGRERHVGNARDGNLPYPQRALRNDKYLYIRNFQPDRWPMGNPLGVTETSEPEPQALENNTRIAFPDLDASPTKAWLVAHRRDAAWKPFYDYAFAKRPMEELYDLAKDPDQVVNVAGDAQYAEIKERLARQLLHELAEAGDPRVQGDGSTFDKPPYSLPEAPPAPRANAPRRRAPQ